MLVSTLHTKLFVLERTEKSGGIINHLLRVNGKEWKIQHQIPEFGHKMKKTPCTNVHY
jgi:hypothetical protein